MISRFLTAAAATTMVAAPVVASAAPASSASSLSVTKSVRASAPVAGARKAANTGQIAAIAVGVLIAGGIIYAIVDSNDDDSDSN